MARKVVKLFILSAALSGCTMSFQPYPSMSKAEIQAALNQLQQNDQMLAEKMAEIAPKPKKK